MQQEQLKTKQARERLQFDQSRDVAIAFRTNCEIDYVKVRVPRFIRNLQSLGDRVSGVIREFRCAGKIDDLMCGARYFIGEFAGQKDRRLRNSKISRPLLSLIHAAQKRRVFVRCEVGVESGTKLRVHVASWVRAYSPFGCWSIMRLMWRGPRIAVASSSVKTTTR